MGWSEEGGEVKFIGSEAKLILFITFSSVTKLAVLLPFAEECSSVSKLLLLKCAPLVIPSSPPPPIEIEFPMIEIKLSEFRLVDEP